MNREGIKWWQFWLVCFVFGAVIGILGGRLNSTEKLLQQQYQFNVERQEQKECVENIKGYWDSNNQLCIKDNRVVVK